MSSAIKGSSALVWTGLLEPLAPVYAAGLALKNMAYTRGWLPGRQLRAPVISIGNLSVGGAGKTPLVIYLAQLLAARGFDVDVLSRGYGRRSRVAEQVLVDREQADKAEFGDGLLLTARFGDEPVLIAQASGVPVYVGVSRYDAGRLAEKRARVPGRPRVHLLDDGFQHRQLARVVDIVVLHRSDFTAGLLPAGRLREPLAALRRASIAVLRVEDVDLEPELRQIAGTLPIWRIAREIELPEATAEGAAVAFCGIAHPEEFFQTLSHAGARLAATHGFRDHHVYTDADVGALIRSVQTAGAQRLLTTEKDLVRLSVAHRARLGKVAALVAVPLRAGLLDEDAAVTELLRLAGLSAGPTAAALFTSAT